MMELTSRQIHRLEKAVSLIEDVLRVSEEYDCEDVITWLAAAENYCREVKMEIKEALEDGQDKERLFECSACFYVFDIQAEQNNMLGNDRECPECGAHYTLKRPENHES